jgi:hypothetical protein
MEKCFIHLDVIIVADEQSAKVSEPCEGSFHFVAFAVAAKFPAVVEGGFLSSVSVRTDQDDASFEQAPAQWINRLNLDYTSISKRKCYGAIRVIMIGREI